MLLDAAGGLHFSLSPSLQELLDMLQPKQAPPPLALLDMPMGLPHRLAPVRGCDVAGRRLLGRRRATIFPPPCREALKARDYAEACRINQRHLGRKLSLQAFNIMPKIKEVDEFLQQQPERAAALQEAHPELAFAALSGAPLPENKRHSEGRAKRLQLLAAVLPEVSVFLQNVLDNTLRSNVAADDVLDALVLAWAAGLGIEGLCQLPLEEQQHDAAGLPMRIVVPACLLDAGPD